MQDRVAWLESQVASLIDRVATLEQRLASIEGRGPAATPGVADDEAIGGANLPPIVDLDKTRFQQLIGLTGRTLVVLGGAYLLRALTESHVLTTSAGVSLGILYSAPWLLLASRAARRGAELDAFAHAVTAALIGYPLVWEATLRFKVLSPAQSAALLGALTGAALLLAWARELAGLAWVVTLGTLISIVGLAIGTGDWTAYTTLAIAVGLATLWLGYTRGWTVLRWPAAAVANTTLLILVARAAAAGQIREALLVQMLMLGGYLGSFAIRTLVIGRPVIPFEVVQSIGVLAVAYGGAIVLIRSTDSDIGLAGVASLGLAAFAYVIAFSFVDRRRPVKNFQFYALLAQLFAIVGIVLSAGEDVASLLYSLAAFLTAALARYTDRHTLSLQAAVYAIAATLSSGLWGHAASAFISSPTSDWGFVTLPQILALSAILWVTFLRVRRPAETWGIPASALRLVLIVVLTWIATGTAIALSMAILPGREHIGGPLLATIRTTALVIATLTLSVAARLPGGREAAWLVFPMLFVTGAKVIAIDFPQGHPQTLFAALAIYGIGLIAAPRLARRPPPTSTTSAIERRASEGATADPAAIAGEVRKETIPESLQRS